MATPLMDAASMMISPQAWENPRGSVFCADAMNDVKEEERDIRDPTEEGLPLMARSSSKPVVVSPAGQSRRFR